VLIFLLCLIVKNAWRSYNIEINYLLPFWKLVLGVKQVENPITPVSGAGGYLG